jgi:hypothetical protein
VVLVAYKHELIKLKLRRFRRGRPRQSHTEAL